MKIVATALISMFSALVLQAQTVVKIPDQWKFRTGDDMSYKEITFDDSDWKNIKVPGYWEQQGWEGYSGAAWYRVKVVLPQELQTEDLILDLGQVDDIDETYWNGEKIGFNGQFPPNTQASHSQFRRYKIPKHLLKAENQLAVRVYDTEGEGGICCDANLTIYPYKEYEKKIEAIRANKSSYFQLTTSNGLLSAVYNSQHDVIENIYPHIFAMIDSAVLVKPFATNLKTNRKDKPVSVAYKENTHVLEVKYANVTINYFASFTKEDKNLYFEINGEPKAIKELVLTYETPAGAQKIDVATLSKAKNGSSIGVIAYEKGKPEDGLMAKELAFMKKVFARCIYPTGMNTDERNAFEQGLSIMKMSQVSDKEIYPNSHGQVLASLRPGVWAICWVRDGAYALMAMARVGMHEEARKGLDFMLKAEANRFRNHVHTDGKDYGPDVDYQISLTRYFGNGKEECDFNENGPNIEFDDWGLFLMALNEYVINSNDWAFFKQWQSVINAKVGDAILHVIQENGLLQRDSGPWEHHLPGNQYTFTNVVNSVGLAKLAAMNEQVGTDGSKYANGSKRIHDALHQFLLVDNRYFRGNIGAADPAAHRHFDAATFELFASDFFYNPELFKSHMQVYDEQLIVNPMFGKDRGYVRINSFDSYENQEWPFAGLRVAVAQLKYGNPEKAKHQIDRITAYAKHNYNQIPEILTNEDIQYTGAIPMVGYGSGAYILALLEYYKTKTQ